MPVYLDCQVCGKEFGVPPSRAKTAKACSHECAVVVRRKSISRGNTLNCPCCGEDFPVPACHMARRRFCSEDCRQKSPQYREELSARNMGKGNGGWKGGEHVRVDGYIYQTASAHPYSGSNGCVLQHRLVMEEWLNKHEPDSPFLISLGNRKYLSPDYDVHHKDFDTQNNRIENLQCLTRSEHSKLHNALRRK